MATVLDKPLKREVSIDGKPYILTITPDGVKITEKGRRIGRELSWKDLLSGDATLATQLLRSVEVVSSKPSADGTASTTATAPPNATRRRKRAAK